VLDLLALLSSLHAGLRSLQSRGIPHAKAAMLAAQKVEFRVQVLSLNLAVV